MLIPSSLPELKLNLLKYGVTFTHHALFSNYGDIHLYKTKYIKAHPISRSFQVYDISPSHDLIPSEIILTKSKNTTIVKLRYNTNSPFQIRLINNSFKLFCCDLLLDFDIDLVKKNEVLNEPLPKSISSKRTYIRDYVSIVGLDRISILFFDGCYNWICNQPCKFCDLHPRKKNDRVFIPTLNDLVSYNMDVDTWWNHARNQYICALEYSLNRVLSDNNVLPHRHLFFMAGGLDNLENSWKIVLDILSSLANKVDFSKYDVLVNVPPHDSISSLLKLKDLGIYKVQYNIEVIDKDLLSLYCPQKETYSTFIDKLSEAVSILGAGNVRSNIVLGLQDIDSTINGCKALAKLGVVPDYSVFQPKPHTALSHLQSPDINEILVFSKQLCDIYSEHGYEPIFCNLSSRSSIMNEYYAEYKGY